METTKSKITVDEIVDSFKAGLKQAQLRQVFTTSYPKAKVENNLKSAFFTQEDLGIETTDYAENRVAWIDCPEGMTVEVMQAHLDKYPDAVLYKILSSSPILSDDQIQVAKKGLTGDALESFNKDNGTTGAWSADHTKIFLGKIADRQAVRKGGDGADKDELVMFNGKVQYRRVEASNVAREDKDLRDKEQAKESVDLAPAISETKEEVKS